MNFSWNTINRIAEEDAEKFFGPRSEQQALQRPYRRDARKLSTEELVQKLEQCGLVLDQAQFRVATEPYFSAQTMCETLRKKGRIRVPKGVCEDWPWLAITTLWERWQADRPCFEMLDDKMQAGYELMDKNPQEASEIWHDVWQWMLKYFHQSNAKSFDEFDEAVGGTQSLFNWTSDFEMTLSNSICKDPKYAHWLIQFSDQMIELSADNILRQRQFLRSQAEAIAALGDRVEAEQLFEDELADDPTWGWGWIGWADLFRFCKQPDRDDERAESILRQGLEVDDVEDRDMIIERLCHIYEDTGRTDEIKAIRESESSRRKVSTSTHLSADGRVSKQSVSFSGGIPLNQFGELQAQAKAAFSPTDFDDVDDEPIQALTSQRVGRNDPCTCGSGKKFKKCCGR